MQNYLPALLCKPPEDVPKRSTVVAAFQLMAELEWPLQKRLVEYISSHDDLRLIGSAQTGISNRVAQVSFVHKRAQSEAVVQRLVKAGIHCRNGHMFAYRLAKALPGVGVGTADGCVRLSLVHYNTPTEVERCIAALEDLSL